MARTKTNDRKSNSFALFGDNAYTVGSNNIDLFDKVVKKSKDTNVTEQYGSQHTDEKPESSKHGDKENRPQAKRGFRSLKVNKDNIDAESNTSNTERQDRTKTDRGNKPSGSKPGNVSSNDNKSVTKTGRGERKVQKDKGRTGVHKNDGSDTETLDLRNVPIGKFSVTDKINTYSIQGKPRIIDDFTSEVIIDGKRYKVSSWSIRDGKYIQGLDSMFLVSKYNVNKRK